MAARARAGQNIPAYTRLRSRSTGDEKRTRIGFLDDKGFHSWRLNGFAFDGGEIAVDVAGASLKAAKRCGSCRGRLPRKLTAEIELARLEKANEIAGLLAASYPGIKLGRVSLNVENGRIAQIEFDDRDETADGGDRRRDRDADAGDRFYVGDAVARTSFGCGKRNRLTISGSVC